MGAIESILEQIIVFKGLSEQQHHNILEISEIKQYHCGDHIFDEGTESHDLYVVLEGQIDIMIDPALQGNVEKGTIGLKKIAEKTQGTSLGEISLIDKSSAPNSAICASGEAKLLKVSKEAFAKLYQEDPESSYKITQNIATILSAKVRESTSLVAQQTLSNYYLYFLCEELAAEAYQCDTIIPLNKKLVIRDEHHFMLSGTDSISGVVPQKEDLDLAFFSTPNLLQKLLAPGNPSGVIVLNTLFSLIGSNQINGNLDQDIFEVICDPGTAGKSGCLVVNKQYNSHQQTFFIQWEVKGINYDPESSTTTANIFIYLGESQASVGKYVEELISSINMPIQKNVHDNLSKTLSFESNNLYNVFVLHHRTHEVVMTLKTLNALGLKIDAFIGIPYGDSNWSIMRMLDHVSEQTYRCLRSIQHPIEPTQFKFDFKQSSFIKNSEEKSFTNLYNDSEFNRSYMSAMTKLVETELVRCLQKCLEQKKKLLIYEDGGYAVPLIYKVYQDSNHPLHSLFKKAVDEKIIVGAVEVTAAGERRDLEAIQDYGGKTLLPVLSTARDDIKVIFEAKGVSQAIIDSTSTALGRLGLPTFETRKVAIIGGNGAIGTRLVEELTEMQNSTSNVFCVDLVDQAFSREIDSQRFPYAAIKVDYLNLGRYLVKDTCLPLIIDLSFGDRNSQLYSEKIEQSVKDFFSSPKYEAFNELVITNSFPTPESSLQTLWGQNNKLKELWASISEQFGYASGQIELLANGQGMSQIFSKENSSKKVTLLVPEQILAFRKVTRLIESHIDTIIGISGSHAFDEQDLNAFLTRENIGDTVDELILVSGSSKDYEFKTAIVFLGELLEILSEKTIDVEQQLACYQKYYEQKLCFILDSDFEIVNQLFSSPQTPDSLIAKLREYPEFIQSKGLSYVEPSLLVSSFAEWVRQKIKNNIAIKKYIHHDIGITYNITVNNQSKRLVLLADGFVINFFAQHEKGVKTEYIDPIVTMQLLGLVKLATTEKAIEPGVYRMEQHLETDDMDLFWKALDDKSRPVQF